ncbi:hypothetical protein BRC20_00555, partial [Candidatus Saccharibacteria bacterium QS_8_54_8]
MADKSDNQSKQENDGKGEALETAVSQIEKQFGSGAIMRFGDKQSVNVETFPSGSLSLDIALGGGVPKGRIVEVFGPEASGKTTLALHMIAESIREGTHTVGTTLVGYPDLSREQVEQAL